MEPRPSATVLLVRDTDPWELLMVQRPCGADFAPSAFVFPGGAVHADDRSQADALRAAAVRELFEETGILLARGAAGEQCAALRRRVAGADSFFVALEELGVVPAFDDLVLFARWVTPALMLRRFDARFYLARMPEAQTVWPQEGEIVDWRWVAPGLALASSDLNLVYATRAVLESVADAPDVDSLFSRAQALTEIPIVQPRIVRSAQGWEVVRD